MTAAKRYRAFISYSQRDKSSAVKLQRELEKYQVPKGVKGDFYLAEKRRLGRFFRDDDDMSASGDIGSAVRAALADSDHLIVVCSPNAAGSKWVNSEIYHYREANGVDGVFAVIVAGEPNSQTPESECFPPLLRTEGESDNEFVMPIEPLGIDVRKESNDRVIARIAAGLLNIEFDDLWQRQRRQMRNRRLINLALVCLVAVLVLMYQARQLWLQGLDQSTILALAADSQADMGRYNSALRLAVLANQEGRLQPTVPAAHLFLQDAARNFPVSRYIKVSDSRIGQARFAPDGKQVLVLGKEISVWDPASGEQVMAFGDGSGLLGVLSVSPDGRYVLASGKAKNLAVYSVQSGEEIYRHEHQDDLYGGVFCPDSEHFASGSVTAYLKSVTTGETIAEKRLKGIVFSAACSANSKYVALGSFGGEVAVFEVATGELVSNFFYTPPAPDRQLSPIERMMASRGGGAVHFVNFSPDGQLLLVGYSSGALHVWDIVKNTQTLDLDGHSDRLRDGAFSPDGSLIGSASRDGTVRFWSTETGKETAVVSAHQHDVRALKFHPSGNVALSAGKDGSAKILDVRSGEVLLDMRLDYGANDNSEKAIWHAEFSHDGSQVLTAHESGHVAVWGLAGEVPVWSQLAATYDGFTRGAVDLAFVPETRQVVLAGYADNTTLQRIWDYQTGDFVKAIEGRWAQVRDPLVSPDAKFLYAWSEYSYYQVRQFDLETGEKTGKEINKGITLSVSMSPDGKKILLVNDYFASVVVDARTMEELYELETSEKQLFGAFAPDGSKLVTMSKETLSFWRSDSGALISQITLPGEFGYLDIQVRNDDVQVLGSSGNRLQLRSLIHPEQIKTISGLEDFVTRAVVSPELTRVAVGYRNGVIAIWDLEIGRWVARFEDHSDPSERQRVNTGTLEVYLLAFSPDSRYLLTGGKDKKVRSYDLNWLLSSQERNGMNTRDVVCSKVLQPDQRLLTVADIEAAPMLEGREGEDVCASVELWSGEARLPWLR